MNLISVTVFIDVKDLCYPPDNLYETIMYVESDSRVNLQVSCIDTR